MAKERSTSQKGYVGETYVMFKLMRDFNIASVKVPQQFFSFDLITSNNKRLEIKTAIARDFERKHPKKTYYYKAWEFRRSPKQQLEDSSDYMVCIGFQSQDMSHEPECFIIPSEQLRGRKVVKITINPKRGLKKLLAYKDRWDLIVNG